VTTTRVTPRNTPCTRIANFSTYFVSQALGYLGVFDRLDARQPKSKSDATIPHHKVMTTAEMFTSPAALNSTTFSEAIFEATKLQALTPSKMVRVTLGGIATVISDPDQAKKLFTEHKDKLSTSESIPLFDSHFSEPKENMKVIMAMDSQHPHYTPTRTLYTSTFFTDAGLKKLHPHIQQLALRFVKKLKDEKKFDLNELASQFTMRAILEGVVKAPNIEDSMINRLTGYINYGISQAVTIKNVATLALGSFLPWTTRTNTYDTLDAATDNIKQVIADNKEAIFADKESWPNKLIEHQRNIAQADSKSSADLSVTSNSFTKSIAFLMTAGVETSSNNVAKCIGNILLNKPALAAILREIETVNIPPEKMTLDDYARLKQIRNTVIESLRTDPPLPIQKLLLVADVVIDGVEIKAGTQVILNIRELQRSEKYFENPNQFNPDRFNQFDEATMSKFIEQGPRDFSHQYAFIPFGKMRMCPGRKTAIHEAMAIIYTFFYYCHMEMINDPATLTTRTTFGTSLVTTDNKPVEIAIRPRAR
jgi:cytochrome P450